MRIAHFCRSFSPLTQTFIYDSIVELQRGGWDCRVVALGRANEQTRPFPHVHVVSGHSSSALEDLASAPLADQLRGAIGGLHPDLVHAHFGPEGALVAPISAALGVPLVVSFHGWDVWALSRKRSWQKHYRRLLEIACRVTVVSPLQEPVLRELGCSPQKIVLLRAGKRLSELPFSEPKERPATFLCVGRFVEKKGHLDAVRAIQLLLERRRPVRVRIIGDGPLLDAVSRYVEEHALQHAVSLLGPLPYAEVIDEMRRADGFLLCSRTAADGDREGVPMVLMEAQALGLPCVSTWHAGIPEVIPEANRWLLAAERDVRDIAHRIELLWACSQEERIAIARRGRAMIERDFDLDLHVSKLGSLYRELLHPGAA